jgi:hypothetical protein
MSVDANVRTTLRQAADGAPAPPIDSGGFERRVRRYRQRRRAGLAGGIAVVAAIVLAVPLAVSQLDSRPGTTRAPVAGIPDPNRPPVYFYSGGGHLMLDPTGRIHEVADGYYRGFNGRTHDGAVVSAREGGGGLVRVRAVHDGDQWRLERSPLSDRRGDVGAVSTDGRRFAVTTLGGDIAIYDLSTNREIQRKTIGVRLDPGVMDFSDRVLWSDGEDSVWLGFGPGRIDVPVAKPPVVFLEAGGDVVAVEDRASIRLYDVSGGTARPIGKVSGEGSLSPDGRYYLSQHRGGGRVDPLRIWEPGSDVSHPVSGVEMGDGVVTDISWADNDTVALMTDGNDRSTMWTCEAATRQCKEALSSSSTQFFLMN